MPERRKESPHKKSPKQGYKAEAMKLIGNLIERDQGYADKPSKECRYCQRR
jgi:hypothetical protein